jgi:hypothetical protein
MTDDASGVIREVTRNGQHCREKKNAKQVRGKGEREDGIGIVEDGRRRILAGVAHAPLLRLAARHNANPTRVPKGNTV